MKITLSSRTNQVSETTIEGPARAKPRRHRHDRDSKTRKFLRVHHAGNIDYVRIVRHLRSLPFGEEDAIAWEVAILDYFEIGAMLKEPESAFVDAVMQRLIIAGLFTLVPSSDQRRYLRKHGIYDPVGPEEEVGHRFRITPAPTKRGG